MFRRTSSCPHFTSPPPTPPPSSSRGEGDKEPTRRPLPRCRLQLPPPTRPPASHAAGGGRIRPLSFSRVVGSAVRGAGFSRASAAVLGAVAPRLGVRQRGTARSLPDLTPRNLLLFKSPSPGLD